MVFFLLTVAVVQLYGNRSRIYLPERKLIVVDKAEAVYAALKAEGVRGRVGLYFSRHLNFVHDSKDDLLGGNHGFPVMMPPVPGVYERRLVEQNVLWVTAKANILRELYHIVPGETFPERADAAAHDPLYVRTNNRIESSHEAVPRTITTAQGMPRIAERVIVVFHPSFFAYRETPEEVISLFRNGLVRPDIIIFCIAAEYDQKEARDRLLRFKEMIERS